MNERALIIVPHQDDETNLIGNIADVLLKKYELFVLYSSLDVNKKKGAIRKKEGCSACGIWGIDKEHIIFLDFPDTPNSVGHHWYSDKGTEIVNALKTQILNIIPTLIIATDFDFHSDHRMLSLALDKSMGQILRQCKGYHPIVLKGFCYETSFYGIEDYSASDLARSIPGSELLSNPSFEWEKRISISSGEKAGFIWKRKAFKALEKHKSQYAVLHARSIINSDNVFWMRRTDSLMYSACLSSSVSDAEKVRDFLILDTDDIITVDPLDIDYSKSCCVFQKDDWLSAEWEKYVTADRIIVHGCINNLNQENTCVLIIADGNILFTKVDICAYGRETVLMFPQKRSFKKLLFHFLGENTCISEIEVVDGDSFIQLDSLQEVIPTKYNALIDTIDYIGYQCIVLKTKIIRKIITIAGD